jgi:hypothetical protein
MFPFDRSEIGLIAAALVVVLTLAMVGASTPQPSIIPSYTGRIPTTPTEATPDSPIVEWPASGPPTVERPVSPK